jgi:hypothetical protein
MIARRDGVHYFLRLCSDTDLFNSEKQTTIVKHLVTAETQRSREWRNFESIVLRLRFLRNSFMI